MSKSANIVAGVGGGASIMAPAPVTYDAGEIAKNPEITIPKGSKVYVFITSVPGATTKIEGMNQKSAFSVTTLNQGPAGAESYKQAGQWYAIATAKNAEEGMSDNLSLTTYPVVHTWGAASQTQSMQIPEPTKKVTFKVSVGPTIFYAV